MVTLGATGPELISLAKHSWHRGPVDEQAAIEAIGRARSLGTNFSGTAQAYRSGQVEETRASRC